MEDIVPILRDMRTPLAVQSADEIERLRAALQRITDRFKQAVAGKPIRDMEETLAEVAAALRQ